MPEELDAWLPVEERVSSELRRIRAFVSGVDGSLTATSDGLLVAHDLPDREPTQIAALVATTLALGSRMTLSTGRGEFRETVTRGTDGYLAVYAAGRTSIVAVIGSPGLNVGMLHYQVRDIIERIAAYSSEFSTWASPANVRTATSEPYQRGDHRPGAQASHLPPVLPERRRPTE
jgi:uncharacterized protein